ncbi:hypothetical protein SAMN06295905_2538 [Devosia lucknowensis]|uniref:Uncharacterized protein n=1 Tax=Devosia lucknowensis TaxID=1096929 RepID=A0A1Y6G4U5_9HYPH|nr:hypothetical protein [Devosia lucknowensis]SMQ85261.1 hypothetical protein SAMN06295905_2538 [Devosia lucknowensis]
MEFGGQAMWLILLTLGVVVLAAAMIYGTMRNRTRTLGERVMTEVETKREYEREDRDPS